MAAVNSPASTVLAGPAADLEALAALLGERSVTARFVPGDYAFHSPAMEPFAEELRSELGELTAVARPAAFLSTVSPDEPPATLDADYWAANVHRPVLFWPAVRALLTDCGADFIEIGPHPTLVRPLTEALATTRRPGTAVASLRRDSEGPAGLLTSLAQLHCAGAPVGWDGLLPGRLTDLPRHPWQHESFWLPEVTPGMQYAAGAGLTAPAAAPAAARLSVQLLDADGRPFGPAQQLDMAPSPAGGVPAAAAPVAAAQGPAALTSPEEPVREPAPSVPASLPGTGTDEAGAGRSRRELMRRSCAVLSEVLGHDPGKRISTKRGFADLGIDSFTVVEFVDRLGLLLELDIPLSAPFEYPCLDELVDYLLPLYRESHPAAGAAAAQTVPEQQEQQEPARQAPQQAAAVTTADSSPVDDPIAIVGIGCRFPGGADAGRVLAAAARRRDAIRDVPGDRWDGEGTTVGRRIRTPGKMYLAARRIPGRRRRLRRRLLRHLAARGPQPWTRSSGCCWRSPGRRWRTPAPPGSGCAGSRDRRVRRRLHATTTRSCARASRPRRRRLLRHRATRFSVAAGPALLRPRPARPEHGGRHRLLVVAGRGAPGLPEPAPRRVRLALAGGVNLDPRARSSTSASRRLRDARRRRALQDLRRRRRRLRARRGLRRGRAQAAVRCAGRRRPRPAP